MPLVRVGECCTPASRTACTPLTTPTDRGTLTNRRRRRPNRRSSTLVCLLLLAPPARASSQAMKSPTVCRATRLIKGEYGFVVPGTIVVGADRRSSVNRLTEQRAYIQQSHSRAWLKSLLRSGRSAVTSMAVSAGIESTSEQSRQAPQIDMASGCVKSASLRCGRFNLHDCICCR